MSISPRRRGPAPGVTVARAVDWLRAPREAGGSSSAIRPSREFSNTLKALGRVASPYATEPGAPARHLRTPQGRAS